MSDMPLASPQGFSVPMAPASDLRSAYERTNHNQVTPSYLICVMSNPVACSQSSSGDNSRQFNQYELEEQEQFRRHQQQVLAQQQQNEPIVVATLIADDSQQNHSTGEFS